MERTERRLTGKFLLIVGILATVVAGWWVNQKNVTTATSASVSTGAENVTVPQQLLGEKSPIEWVRRGRKADQESFESSAIQSFEYVYNASAPGSSFRVTSLDTHDHGASYLVRFNYDATVPGPDGKSIAIRGATSRLFHSNGLLQIEAACVQSQATCDVKGARMSQAIEKGRGALLEATIDGVLPVDDVESCANGVHKAELFGQKIENLYQLCKYRDGMTLSFMRIPASQVMATFDAMSKSQEGKDLIK